MPTFWKLILFTGACTSTFPKHPIKMSTDLVEKESIDITPYFELDVSTDTFKSKLLEAESDLKTSSNKNPS